MNSQIGVGTNQISTYYKGYLRVSLSMPSLQCENINDNYTVSSSSKGNKSLSYPIGMITADEVLLSGVSGGEFNGSYNYQKESINGYLTTGNSFWTITPAGGYNPYGGTTEFHAVVFLVENNGNINAFAYDRSGLRPVINIRSDVTISGDGTMESPYTIS